jgi:hypothetical protein
MAQSSTKVPGTLPVADNLYLDQMPVSNVDWKEFLFFVRLDSGADRAVIYLPDTNIWHQTSHPELANTYFQDPANNRYPVVGITPQQAKTYASWRSAIVSKSGLLVEPEKFKRANCRKMQKLADKGKVQYDTTLRVVYSLPTSAELAQANALVQQLGPPKGKYVPIADGLVKGFDFRHCYGSAYMFAPNVLLSEYASTEPNTLLWGFRCAARIETR